MFASISLVMACGDQGKPAAQNEEPGEQIAVQSNDDHSEEEHGSDSHLRTVDLSAVDLSDGNKLNVVATTNIVGDLVRKAKDTDIPLVPIYTGSLGENGSGAENYLDAIRDNTSAIVEALK